MKTLNLMIPLLFAVSLLTSSSLGQQKQQEEDQSQEGQTIKILREIGSEEIERDRERTAALKQRLEKFIQSRPVRRPALRKQVEPPNVHPAKLPARQVVKKPFLDASQPTAGGTDGNALSQKQTQTKAAKRIEWFERKFAELEQDFKQLQSEWKKFQKFRQDSLANRTAGK